MNALWILLFLLGFLFLVKAIYVLTLVIALPRTGGALFCVTHPGKISVVLKALPLGAGDQVLDLGCGDGRFLAAAAQCGARDTNSTGWPGFWGGSGRAVPAACFGSKGGISGIFPLQRRIWYSVISFPT